jgi:hypothetical protein
VERDPTDQLHIEMAHLERAARRLAHDRKGFRQELIERRALLQAFAEFFGLRTQCFIAQLLNGRLELIRSTHRAAMAANDPLIAAAENAGEKLSQSMTRLREK